MATGSTATGSSNGDTTHPDTGTSTAPTAATAAGSSSGDTTKDSMREKHCLSIQSHVVFGYVGNKSATFPLQLHGFDVSPLNSVQFSNHTGYGSWTGDVLEGDQLEKLVAGLEKNKLLCFTHMLTGYMRSPSFVRAALSAVKKLRAANPDCVYVCDPVMGDNGKLYVPRELVDIYAKEIVPHATILTPNSFECHMLTGVPVVDKASAFAACKVLHERGVKTVVITSSAIDSEPDHIQCLVSTPRDTVADSTLFKGKAEGGDGGAGGGAGAGASAADGASDRARFSIKIPLLKAHFTGTGDLMAALLLAWADKLPTDYVGAVEKAVASVQAVCARTLSRGVAELRVIQSRADLEEPTVVLKACVEE